MVYTKVFIEVHSTIAMQEEDLVELRTRVDARLLKKLDGLKAHYGVTENSEILRLLISEMHRRIIDRDEEMERIRKEFRAEVRRLREEISARR